MNRHRVLEVVGICAGVFLGVLLMKAYDQNHPEILPDEPVQKVELTFESETLTYDGEGLLDLMEGVYAQSPEGGDVTDSVQVVLTEGNSMSEKKIVYSVFSEDGIETTKTRTLKLEDYVGPKLWVREDLELEAQDLDQLVDVLCLRNALYADNGFGQDASGDISWVRRAVDDGIYEITFTLENEWQDTDTATVMAVVSGDVKDIVLMLSESNITIPMGSFFDPKMYVLAAEDPYFGDISSLLQIIDLTDIYTPGIYNVVYILRSADGTQEAERVLQVTVTESGDYLYD